jgi:hypothetical protein
MVQKTSLPCFAPLVVLAFLVIGGHCAAQEPPPSGDPFPLEGPAPEQV